MVCWYVPGGSNHSSILRWCLRGLRPSESASLGVDTAGRLVTAMTKSTSSCLTHRDGGSLATWLPLTPLQKV